MKARARTEIEREIYVAREKIAILRAELSNLSILNDEYLLQRALEVFPHASMSKDDEGQLIIHTNYYRVDGTENCYTEKQL